MCCVQAILTNVVSGVQDSIFRCMNKYVTETDYDVKINEFQFALKCVDKGGLSGVQTVSGGRSLKNLWPSVVAALVSLYVVMG